MFARAYLRRGLAGLAMAVAALAFVPVLHAILVAPTAVFMDHRTRSGQLFLVNTSPRPEEVSIELKFGYPTSDSAGGVTVLLVDQPDSTMPSAAGWIRAFPRRTVVQPGEQQVVRLLAQPPLDLPDGEYWSRVIVTSHEIQPPPAANDSGVHAGISVQLRQILSLAYRKGAVTTSLTQTEFQPELKRDSAIVWLGLHRDGNAAFLGSVTIEVHDQAGHSVGEFTSPLAVVFAVRRRFAIPLDSAAVPGMGYTVRFRVSTARQDLKASDVLPAPPLADSAVVRVSG